MINLRKFAALSTSLVVISCGTQNDEIELHGRFISQQQEDFSKATVYCLPAMHSITIDSVSVSSDGSFSMPVKQGDLYRFAFSIPGRRETIAYLYTEHSLELTIELPQDTLAQANLIFRDSSSRAARFYEIAAFLTKETDQARAVVRNLPPAKRDGKIPFDWNPYLDNLNRQIASEPDTLVRQALMIARVAPLIFGDTLSTAAAKSILNAVPLTNPFWKIAPYYLIATSIRADSLSYLDRAADVHPDPWMRAWLMVVYLPEGRHAQDSARVRQYAARVVSEFSGTVFATMAAPFTTIKMTDITVGSVLPAFTFRALNQDKQVSNQDFNNRTYLIAFWATWCQPCVKQLPFLAEAYDKYAAKGLDVLSVSLDDNNGEINNFLKTRPSIRWPQAYAVGAFNNEYIKKLGVYSIPIEFLVDQTGRVLATSEDLIGSKLDATLSRVFKQQ